MIDPIIEEIRKAREEHSKLFEYDLHKICSDLRVQEKASHYKFVSLKPKLRINNTGS